ncbi:MAG: flavin reductase family protein [Burkholderiaceae bacterium]|nr:flavin reductase family protein [Burkholderiaceae bacterium]
MHYPTTARAPGLAHDPFKALVVPRPVGWIATVDRDGRRNLAPYSFFNAVSERPPMVMFSSGGHKDTLRNIRDTGEFTCSLANWDLHEAMNLSSAPVAPGVDEFALAGLGEAKAMLVKPPFVAQSPAAFECRLWRIVELPAPAGRPGGPAPVGNTMVIGEVLAVYIDDRYVRDGIVDTGRMRPVARLGYMDYAVVTPESMFTLNRPTASADGLTAQVQPGPWDGVYR